MPFFSFNLNSDFSAAIITIIAFFLLIFAWGLFLKSFDFPLLFVLGVSLVSDYR